MARVREEVEAEIRRAEEELAALPEDALIERATWRGVLEAAKQALESAKPRVLGAAGAIFLDGAPVAGSRGIEIRFAAQVLEALGMAVHHQGLRHSIEPGHLHLTDRLSGSYGFLLEEAGQPHLPGLADQSPMALALGEISSFIDAAGTKRIETFHSVTPSLAPHAFGAMRTFFRVLDAGGATLRLDRAEQIVRLDRRQVGLAAIRTQGVEVKETFDWIAGVLEGLTRNSRSFELRRLRHVKGTRKVIRGKLDPVLEWDKAAPFYGKRCFAKVRETLAIRGTRTRSTYELVDVVSEAEYQGLESPP